MKAAISLASALAFASSLNAQITTTLDRSSTRSPEIKIRNNAAVSLTAFAIGMAPTAQAADYPPFLVYVDSAVDTDRFATPRPGTAMPILPNQEFAVALPVRMRPGRTMEDLYAPPIVTAGVFADGTTTGDAALLSRLILRRCNLLQAGELASDILSDAGKHNVPRRQLIEQFRKIEDSLNHWYLPPEQQVGRPLYQSIIGKLMTMPELKLGEPFPPTAFVEEETTTLHRQRTALLASQPALTLAEAVPIRK